MTNSNDPNLNKDPDNAPFDPLTRDNADRNPNTPIEMERRSYESTIGVLAVIIVAIVALFILFYFQYRSTNVVTPVAGTVTNSVTTPIAAPPGTTSVPGTSTQTVTTPTGTTQTVTVPATIQTTTTPTGTTSTVVTPTGTQTITSPTPTSNP